MRPVTPSDPARVVKSAAKVFNSDAADCPAVSLATIMVASTLMLPAVIFNLMSSSLTPVSKPARLVLKVPCAAASKLSTVPSKVKLVIITAL